MTIEELYNEVKNTDDFGAQRKLVFLNRITNTQTEEYPLIITGIYPDSVVVEIAHD